jgi:hypothetical protein
MEKQLRELMELGRQYTELYHSVHAKYGIEILARIRRYIAAEHPTNQGYGYPSDRATFEWVLEIMNGVPVIAASWDERWAYGGHDSGTSYIRLEYFLDDGSKLAAYEAERTAEKAEAARAKQDEAEAAERAKLAELQKKYAPQ